MRERDLRLERMLTATAAAAHGLPGTGGLDAFADQRALPGGVRIELDADLETAEELADARNYLVWGIEPIYAAMVGGESVAGALYARRMRTLGHIAAAWHALQSGAPA